MKWATEAKGVSDMKNFIVSLDVVTSVAIPASQIAKVFGLEEFSFLCRCSVEERF